MLKNHFQTARIAVLGLMVAGAVFGQTTRVQGTVIGFDGKPLQNAEMKFERTDIKGEYSIKTNDKGEYDYPTLPRGTYNMTLLIDDTPVFQMPGIKTNLAKPSVIDINLQELQAKQAAAQGAQANALPPANGLPPAGGAAQAPPPTDRELTAEQLRSVDPSTLTPEQREKYEEQMKQLEEYEASIAAQEAAAKRDQDLQASFNRGMQASEDENWDVAVQALDQASKLDPKQVAVWGNLAIAYTNRGDKKSGDARQADYLKAIDAYQHSIELKPEDANLHDNIAVVMAKAGQFDESMAELAEAGRLNPSKQAGYYYNVGAVLFNRNQAPAAEPFFRKTLELDQKYADAWFQLGNVLIAQASFDDKGAMVAPDGTREAFQKYLDLAPTGANVDAAKGMLQALDATIQTTINQ